jgi:hypothetical protein
VNTVLENNSNLTIKEPLPVIPPESEIKIETPILTVPSVSATKTEDSTEVTNINIEKDAVINTDLQVIVDSSEIPNIINNKS